jgi:putative ABC transport system substrate-binding protein
METRRAFLRAASAALLAAPWRADAQPVTKIPRVGFLQPGTRPASWLDAFRDGLRDVGYVEGQNIIIEYRVAPGPTAHRALVNELVAQRSDMIVTWTMPAIQAAREVTTTLPIVGITGDPVRYRFAETLGRPGGNFTGIAVLTDDLLIKALELLHQALPAVASVAVLSNPDNPVWIPAFKRLQQVAPSLTLTLHSITARAEDGLDAAFADATRRGAGAVLIVNDGLFSAYRARVVALAMSRRLPTIAADRPIVEAGGLMSYGVDFPKMLRGLARYVDRILKGAKPQHIAIEQAASYELVVNMKTAHALSLRLPTSLLLRADRVIE